MDSRPVFVLITAKTCHACHGFRSHTWEDLKTELIKQGKVQVVEIDVPNTQSKPDSTQYHPQLSRFIGWFPTMSLYPADRWNNHLSTLIGIIKNGKIVPPSDEQGEHIETVGKMNLSKDDILKWVDYTITKEKMFSGSQTPHNPPNNPSNIPTNNEPKIIKEKIRVPTSASVSASYRKFQPSKVN